jgi:hypothetical protein
MREEAIVGLSLVLLSAVVGTVMAVFARDLDSDAAHYAIRAAVVLILALGYRRFASRFAEPS